MKRAQMTSGFATALIALGGAGAALTKEARSGVLTGASNHEACSGVEPAAAAAGCEIRQKADVWFDGAADPRIGFGDGGRFVAATDSEPSRRNSGAQAIARPMT